MSEITIPSRFLVRGGTAAAIAALNDVPKERELYIEIDTGKWKLGDGITAYNSLPYRQTVDDSITNAVTDRAPSQNAVFDALALKQDAIPFAVAAGTANALTADFAPNAVLADGLEVRIRANAANTIAPTLAVDGGAALAITKLGGTALVAGDIKAAGHELLLRYRLSVPQWELINPAASGGKFSVGATFESTITISSSNAKPIERPMPVGGTIVGMTIFGDNDVTVGSCVIDVRKATYAAYPTFSSIAASAKPTITAGYKNTDSTLTGWTTVIAAGDILRFVLESSTVFKRITIILEIQP